MLTTDWNPDDLNNLQDLVTTQTLEEDADGGAEPTDLWEGLEPEADADLEPAKAVTDASQWLAEVKAEAEKTQNTQNRVQSLKQLARDEATRWYEENGHLLTRNKKQEGDERPTWGNSEEPGLTTMQLSGAPTKNGTCKAGTTGEVKRPTEQRKLKMTDDHEMVSQAFMTWYRDGHNRKVGAPQCLGHKVQGHTGTHNLKRVQPNDGLVVHDHTLIQPWHLADADYKADVKAKAKANAAENAIEPYKMGTTPAQVILRPGMDPVVYGTKPWRAVKYADWNGLRVAHPVTQKPYTQDRVDVLPMWTLSQKQHQWVWVETELSPAEKREKARVLSLPKRKLEQVTWVMQDQNGMRSLLYANELKCRKQHKTTEKGATLVSYLTNWRVTTMHTWMALEEMNYRLPVQSMEALTEGCVEDAEEMGLLGVSDDPLLVMQRLEDEAAKQDCRVPVLTSSQYETLVKRAQGLRLDNAEWARLKRTRKQLVKVPLMVGR